MRRHWRALLGWRGWRPIRVPLALVCLAGGLAGVGMPVWSGWWTAHVQHIAAHAFTAELQAPASSSGASASTPTPVSSATAALPPAPDSLIGASSATGGKPRDVATGDPLAELRIPAIGLDTFVLEGLTYAPSVWTVLLRQGPAHLLGSALPGQAGNVVIFGHLNIWGSVFAHLYELKRGATVDMVTSYGSFHYQVTGSQTITPTDLSAVAPRQTGPAIVQLVTCTGVTDQYRLVVDASLVPAGKASAP